jgi:hypothetical protein
MLNTLIITPQGYNAIDYAIQNHQVMLINSVKFSDAYQPEYDQNNPFNTLYGTNINGYILLDYRMIYQEQQCITMLLYADKLQYPTDDYIPRSFGIFKDNGTLIAYSNIKPSGDEVGSLVKAGLVLWGKSFPPGELNPPAEYIQVVTEYEGIFDVDQYVKSLFIDHESRSIVTENNVPSWVYYRLNNNLKIYPMYNEVRCKFLNNYYRVKFNENEKKLYGELIQ